MSVVDFRRAAAGRYLGQLVHGELDGLCDELTQCERRDVRDMLDLVAHRLAARSQGVMQFRSRLDAIIASLIGVADALDGDHDLEDDDREDVSEDEGAQCDDEGHEESGVADLGGLDEVWI